MRSAAFFAFAGVLGALGAGPLPAHREHRVPEPFRCALETTDAPHVRAEAAALQATWAESLGAVEVLNRNTQDRGTVRLYHDDGLLDRDALRAFQQLAGGDELDTRLVQLVFRAAYHFGGKRIEIVSATRKGTRGKHAHGEAIDFALDGVKASQLAAYLRGTPLAGVGIYTHPRTQYAHLDVRDASFHWIDASPPGVTWREQRLPDPKGATRDATWTSASDLPEH